MTNSFAKKIDIAFEKMVQGFKDALAAIEIVTIMEWDAKEAERSNNVRWFPQPYIAKSNDGDTAPEFEGVTRLLVPATINKRKHVRWELSSDELNDALENEHLREAADQRLGSDINASVLEAISYEGTVVSVKSTAASEYGDVSAMDSIFNRTGVMGWSRHLALTSDDANGLARDLANRSTPNETAMKAYRENYLGKVAGFDTVKLDYGIRLAAAGGGGGLTVDTRAAASNYHVPKTDTVENGNRAPFDNRYQTITVSSTAGMARGDAFTIAGVTEVHHIQKGDTGKLKTFRVKSVSDGTHVVISPPIISNQGGTLAEEVYKNCVVSESAAAAIVFLNIAAAPANPFLQKDAVWLIPGRIEVRPSGLVVRRANVKGIDFVMTEQSGIGNLKTKFRVDAKWGVTVAQPEMCGIKLFNQA